MDKKIEKLENMTFEEDDSLEVPPADIVAYNESRSCADLYRMYKQGILEIQPEFQREIVWKSPAQTRFIDSLTKQLPIPSMCFSMDHKTLRWKVIDGLQRMASIIRFFQVIQIGFSLVWMILIKNLQENQLNHFLTQIHRYTIFTKGSKISHFQ